MSYLMKITSYNLKGKLTHASHPNYQLLKILQIMSIEIWTILWAWMNLILDLAWVGCLALDLGLAWLIMGPDGSP